MKTSVRLVGVLAALLVGVTLSPVGAHVNSSVDHVWEHIKDKLRSLPACGGERFVVDYTTNGRPVCDGVEAFAGFRNNAQITSTMQPVATLELNAGHYAIFAKVNAQPPASGQENPNTSCILAAGGDTDEAAETTTPTVPFGTMALNVVHQFTDDADAAAVLSCKTTNPSGGVSQIKMTAIRLSSISNVPLN